MISYIFSGFDVKEHFGNDVSEYFKKDMKECKRNDGVTLNVNILDDNTEEDVMIDNIKNADIIFIMGGDTQRQNLFLERYKLKKMIKEANGIVIGVSAGAINLGGISLCSWAYETAGTTCPFACRCFCHSYWHCLLIHR